MIFFFTLIRHVTKMLILMLLCAEFMTAAMGYAEDKNFTRWTP